MQLKILETGEVEMPLERCRQRESRRETERDKNDMNHHSLERKCMRLCETTSRAGAKGER
jgi:hypothetical protein